MRFIRPNFDSVRVKRWFALLPVYINKETRWLEMVKVEQIFERNGGYDGDYYGIWVNKRFLD